MLSLRRLILCLTCFTSGGCILIMELCGIRMLAPTFGNALFTWTSLIGIILLAVALGDYLGGWLIDKTKSNLLIPLLLILASIYMIISYMNVDLVSSAVGGSFIWGPMLGSLFLFFTPALFLSSITPISVRLFSLSSGDQCIGVSSGTIGMCSTLGSFCGTILAGFFIIPYADLEYVLLYLAGTLTTLAVIFGLSFGVRPKDSVVILAGIYGFILIGLFTHYSKVPGLIFAKTTSYHRIQVIDLKSDNITTRLLKLDRQYAGSIHVEDGSLVFLYQKYWILIPQLTKKLDHLAFLGAGAFGMPCQLAGHFQKSIVQVAEIDPTLIAVGENYFGLKNHPNITTFAEDARRFINNAQPDSFDLIVGDCYSDAEYIPPHLLTQEFCKSIRSRLHSEGLFMMNLSGIPRGPRSFLYQAVLGTIQTSFPYLKVYATHPEKLQDRQNILIFAKTVPFPNISNPVDNPELLTYMKSEIPPDIHADGTIITDHRNPIDLLILAQWQ